MRDLRASARAQLLHEVHRTRVYERRHPAHDVRVRKHLEEVNLALDLRRGVSRASAPASTGAQGHSSGSQARRRRRPRAAAAPRRELQRMGAWARALTLSASERFFLTYALMHTSVPDAMSQALQTRLLRPV